MNTIFFNSFSAGISSAIFYLGVVFHTPEAMILGVIGTLFFFFKN
jgi:hypothetical protein